MTAYASIDSSRPVATLINVFTVPPARQRELLALLAHATETTMKHQPGFICANFHASQDGQRVVNYAQWESEDHYWAMRANPEAQVHMDQAATIATDVQPGLFTVASHHPRA
ncbi:antibiotic biosynthesis monooxygenase family protein [Streptomyces sp. NPDC058486]|uniref:antibiotic biosynthesis monooxygenase family protein n=1 Tax=unclassified Streptomyces TaxID=2593676 RepID=UPI00364E13C4